MHKAPMSLDSRVGLWACDRDGQGVDTGSFPTSYRKGNTTAALPLGLTDFRRQYCLLPRRTVCDKEWNGAGAISHGEVALLFTQCIDCVKRGERTFPGWSPNEEESVRKTKSQSPNY